MATKHPQFSQETLEALQQNLASFNFTPEQILALIMIIGDVHEFIAKAHDDITLQKRKTLLAKLLQYLIANPQLAVTHKSLIAAIRLILGIKIEQEHEDTIEAEKEAGLSLAERKRRYELAVYELYKIINPRQLAGETALDNFLNNVAMRGLEVARYYQGNQFAMQFNAGDLVKLASYRHNLVVILAEEGVKSFGRGM